MQLGLCSMSVMFFNRRHLRNIPLESIPFHNLEKILQLLVEERVFFPLCRRKHASFDYKKPLMEKCNHKELCSKIKENIDQILVKNHCPL